MRLAHYAGWMAAVALAGLALNIAFLGNAQASTFPEIAAASYQLDVNGRGNCSGQFVAPDVYLTAAHCYNSESFTYSVTTPDGTVVQMKPITALPQFDVAVFKPIGPYTFPFVDVANEYRPVTGDPIVSFSYPYALGYGVATEGTMTGLSTAGKGLGSEWSYLVNIPTAPGSSGSGIYVETSPGDWELIGTLMGGPPVMNWVSFYSHLPGVHAVIDSLE